MRGSTLRVSVFVERMIGMTLNPPDRREDWTPEQAAQLMRLARQGLTAQRIASQLGRNEETVQFKVRQLGLVLSRSGKGGRA